MNLLLAAGGTGGHVYPALALAHEAQRAGDTVLLLGARGGMEERIAREAGLPFHGVAAGKWDRQRPDPRQAFAALAGLRDAIRTTRRFAPDVVVGFGGFASFPGCIAATVTRTPLLLHEGNVQPGRVTRWFAQRAACVATAIPETAEHLARGVATRHVGFPVREERPDRQASRRALGIPEDAVVTLVMGGSQGSLALNEAVPAAFRTLSESERGFVLHAAGRRWADTVTVATADLPTYHVHAFLDAPRAWAAADLAITRGGISTLSEAAFHGVPLVIVPLPTSADDHQRANARAVADAGAGWSVEQDDAEGLLTAWRALLDPAARVRAGQAMHARSPEGAAARLYELARDAARGQGDRMSREAAS